jgi:TRAP-type C4-dicarboxylate transport system substrate-binding protein
MNEKIRSRIYGKNAYFLFFLSLCITILMTSSYSTAEQIVLKAAYYQPDGHKVFELGRESLNQVEKLTEGRVKFVMYPNSTLIPTTEMASGVDEGTAFCANWYMPYMSKTIPLFNIETESLWTTGSYRAILEAYEDGINDLYTEALYRQGLKNTRVAGVSMCLWRVLGTTKKMVRVPSDIRGMKIRSVGAEADMFQSMGASPVNITTPQTYEALSRGIAEGATNACQIFLERRWIEYIKHVTNINLSPVLMHIIYNTKQLSKLDPRDRPIIEKAMKNLAADTLNGLFKSDEKAIKRVSEEFGAKIYDLTQGEREQWVKAAAVTTRNFEDSKDPLIQKALGYVYKYNPKIK